MTAPQFKLVPMQDALAPSRLPMGDNPATVVAYFREFIQTANTYSQTTENAVVIFLDTRRRVTGWMHIATGTLDTLLVHPREVFRPAMLANAAAIVLAHNHPSGDPTPSEADIKVTRDLVRAGQILKIELLDHLVIGHPAEARGHVSLRELGYLYN